MFALQVLGVIAGSLSIALAVRRTVVSGLTLDAWGSLLTGVGVIALIGTVERGGLVVLPGLLILSAGTAISYLDDRRKRAAAAQQIDSV
jgi:hypothetical protein